MADTTVEQLGKTVETLVKRIGLLEDLQEVRKLQHKYGYYIDKTLYKEVVGLFAEDSTVTFHGGIYKGKAGVKRLYIERFQKTFTNGKNGPIYGFLLDHPQHQDVVDVAEDGKTAKARFRCTMQAGTHYTALPESKNGEEGTGATQLRQWWEGGLYENTYVKIDGKWLIKDLHYKPFWHGTFEKGWSYTPPNFIPFPTVTYPEDPLGPDELDPNKSLWPDTHVLPFHYKHPITGEDVAKADLVGTRRQS